MTLVSVRTLETVLFIKFIWFIKYFATNVNCTPTEAIINLPAFYGSGWKTGCRVHCCDCHEMRVIKMLSVYKDFVSLDSKQHYLPLCVVTGVKCVGSGLCSAAMSACQLSARVP